MLEDSVSARPPPAARPSHPPAPAPEPAAAAARRAVPPPAAAAPYACARGSNLEDNKPSAAELAVLGACVNLKGLYLQNNKPTVPGSGHR